MKTLDEAMNCLAVIESDDAAAREMKIENIRQFGYDVGSNPNCVSLVTATAKEYLKDAEYITVEALILLGLSNFASGARVGVEMERQSPESKTASDMVREFHKAYGVRIQGFPGLPPAERRKLRAELLAEEFQECVDAEQANDLIGIADALADMLYIIHGTALEYGIPLDAVVAEVHRSNMSKLGIDGKPIYRGDGKVMKGPNYSKPDISAAIRGGA